jgi:spermidine dehydrogenase
MTQQHDDRELGMDAPITRRDFVNSTLIGGGASLLAASAPVAFLEKLITRQDTFTGYGGVGDYAKSNGNTWPVLSAAHRLRDGAYGPALKNVVDSGERYDVVIVGAGLSGLTAAWTIKQKGNGTKRVLMLDNHPIFGGEAKQNEFVVGGVKLTAPQGSNQFGAPRAGAGNLADQVWTDLNLPREVAYEEPHPDVGGLRIPLDNYAHMDGVNEYQVDIGYDFNGTWHKNIWQNDLADAPFSPEVKADLLKWRSMTPPQTPREALDRITYKDYLEKTLGLRPEVTSYITPVVGLINGASPDGVSAHAASQIGMPGVSRPRGRTGALPRSFPGGNSTIARHFVKALVPDGISGTKDHNGVFDGRADFAKLDRATNATRMRMGATVVRVAHEGNGVAITYEKGGKLYRVRADKVVMASGGWINKHVITDMPSEMRQAYDQFVYGPAMVVNVALNNWRFMHRLGIAAARWFSDDFGFSCNIRRPMIAGAQKHTLHPDRPTVLTFYMGLYTPGHSAAEQGQLGRTQLFSTSYADYERKLRAHMTKLFGASGFDARRDIAGIILNRWGHARMLQPPNFFYGQNGAPAAREIVQKGFGRIIIGHSELNGHQSMSGAMSQGARAAEQALA